LAFASIFTKMGVLHNLNQNDDDLEEEYAEEYVHTPKNYEITNDENKNVNEEEYDRINEELYKDVNKKLDDVEHEEEGKGDVEKTNVGQDDVNQETTYDQVKDDAHVTLTTVHDTQKTKVPLQSSSISSDFATQFLNMDNVSPAYTKIISIKNINVLHKEPSNQTPSFLTIPVTILPKAVSDFATPIIINTINKSIEKIILAKSSSQPQSTYKAAASLIEFELKKILLDKMQKSKSYRVDQEHKELYDGLVKSYKLDKDLFESYGSKSKESKPSSSKGTKSQPKSSGKSEQEEESVFTVADIDMVQNQGSDLVLVDFFTNNDLEYLKGGSSTKKYTTSTTKTKAAKYDIPGIEDMVSSLWSPVKGFASNKVSKHDAYSIKRIITVTKVKVIKWYDYGYLKEIKVQREDQQLYKFKEGNFLNLYLQDIRDMLLLIVKKKLSNLEGDVLFDLGEALWMFTRCIVILKRVEDL
nr:hypothetical protein [Tanacetum cinerariifolium]